MTLPTLKIHPAFRPIAWGVALFLVFNVILTLGVTFSPVNQKFNFSYGNYLPQKLELLAQKNPRELDVLFLGTSQTNNGFIPAVFEENAGFKLNSFNLGLPNNRYDIMQAYLNYHIRQYGRPKLVLIELSPSTQELDSYYYYLPALYYRTLIEHAPLYTRDFLNHPHLAANVKKELLLSAFSSLHQYRHTFSPLNLLDKISGKLAQWAPQGELVAVASGAQAQQEPAPQGTGLSDAEQAELMAKGWHPYEQSAHMKTPEGVSQSILEARKYYIDHQTGVHFDKLRLLLAYCRENRVPVALVAWPQHPDFTKLLNASPLGRQYREGLATLSAQAAVPVINLVEDLPPNPDPGLFADPRHLTPAGARQFSRILAQRAFALPQLRAQFTEAHLSRK